LNKKGPVLAIDFRGHGESSGDLRNFSEQDFRNMTLDVKAGKEFLKKQGLNVSELIIIGASIGANTALNYGVQDKDVKTIILMSPGLNYRGVTVEENAPKFDGRLLLIASSEDEYSAETCMRLNELAGDSTLKIYNNLGHGTDMLTSKEVRELILNYI
jgi:pimeloyl-ACP methyl ester carboxylesterase